MISIAGHWQDLAHSWAGVQAWKHPPQWSWWVLVLTHSSPQRVMAQGAASGTDASGGAASAAAPSSDPHPIALANSATMAASRPFAPSTVRVCHQAPADQSSFVID